LERITSVSYDKGTKIFKKDKLYEEFCGGLIT